MDLNSLLGLHRNRPEAWCYVWKHITAMMEYARGQCRHSGASGDGRKPLLHLIRLWALHHDFLIGFWDSRTNEGQSSGKQDSLK